MGQDKEVRMTRPELIRSLLKQGVSEEDAERIADVYFGDR